jgi:hypothetical protein
MITFHSEASGFYIKSNQGEREQITGEKKKSTLKLASVQSSERLFKKIEWEFHEIRNFVVDNSLVGNA